MHPTKFKLIPSVFVDCKTRLSHALYETKHFRFPRPPANKAEKGFPCQGGSLSGFSVNTCTIRWMLVRA